KYRESRAGSLTQAALMYAESKNTTRSTGVAATRRAYTAPSVLPKNTRSPDGVGDELTVLPVRKLQSSLPDFRSSACRRPAPSPTYSMSPAIDGDDHVVPVVVRHNSFPVAASKAWTNCASELPAYTTPSKTAGEA